MSRFTALSLLLSLLAPALACDVAEDGDALRGSREDVTRPRIYRPGDLWGPCDLSGVTEPGWWGCNGSLGEGAACLRPVSDDGLTVCVPQTWDPNVNDDCTNLDAPFGLGVRVQGSAYCVADCMSDDDCALGQACSPASGLCAWVGE